MGVLTGLWDAVVIVMLRRNNSVQEIYVGSGRMFEQMNRATALHRMRPVIDRSFGFQEASAALRHLVSGRHSRQGRCRDDVSGRMTCRPKALSHRERVG